MKLKNNGFAISVVLYGLLILFLLLITSLLGILASYKAKMGKLIEDSNGANKFVQDKIENEEKTVIKFGSTGSRERCIENVSDQTPFDKVSYPTIDDAKEAYRNFVASGICKLSEGCYFFENDIDCNDEIDNFICTVKYYNNCTEIPSDMDVEIDANYYSEEPVDDTTISSVSDGIDSFEGTIGGNNNGGNTGNSNGGNTGNSNGGTNNNVGNNGNNNSGNNGNNNGGNTGNNNGGNNGNNLTPGGECTKGGKRLQNPYNTTNICCNSVDENTYLEIPCNTKDSVQSQLDVYKRYNSGNNVSIVNGRVYWKWMISEDRNKCTNYDMDWYGKVYYFSGCYLDN